MNHVNQFLSRPLVVVVIFLAIAFYPMFISIYVFLPLLVGTMGYILILGIEKERMLYVMMALVYFLNLEANLSLPFFLTIIATLLIYVLFDNNLTFIRNCNLCRPVIYVVMIDIFYLGSLLAYDFIFQASSVVLDTILLYSLIVDMLVVVML
ncbi:MAG: Unknown protein [uncultured Sulfurovum sp.]|uniref:Uncharacterized protein n=1 Tax=uncultured Sulfurovum sp. TaxID=269237 RepID=A0A6S6UAE5_9BACT|nr:MAG: Unknown protein [uncultured Sulfurovum sp.]